MLIPFVCLYVFKCDGYTQLPADQTQKDFEYFICFWKCFYTFVCLEFLLKMSISCFYKKKKKKKNTLSEAFLRVSRELAYPAKMRMAKITKHWNSDREFHDCFAGNSYLWKLMSASVAFSRVTLWEAYSQKAHFHSF